MYKKFILGSLAIFLILSLLIFQPKKSSAYWYDPVNKIYKMERTDEMFARNGGTAYFIDDKYEPKDYLIFGTWDYYLWEANYYYFNDEIYGDVEDVFESRQATGFMYVDVSNLSGIHLKGIDRGVFTLTRPVSLPEPLPRDTFNKVQFQKTYVITNILGEMYFLNINRSNTNESVPIPPSLE